MLFCSMEELFDYFYVAYGKNESEFFIRISQHSNDDYHIHEINEVFDGNLVVGEMVAEVIYDEIDGYELLWCSLTPIHPEHVIYEIYQATKCIPLHNMLNDMVHNENRYLSQYYWETSKGYFDTYLFVADTYLYFIKKQNNRHNLDI